MTQTRTASQIASEQLQNLGLLVLGRLELNSVNGDDERLADLPGGDAVAEIWLVGFAGSAFWPHFSKSDCFQDGLPDPLDRWSRDIGLRLAERLQGRALFPFDGPPYLPFQRWAAEAASSGRSPLMLHIHPTYGLWHAYRFALALPAGVNDPQSLYPVEHAQTVKPAVDICASCDGQPCLQACPVRAFDGQTFLPDACCAHLKTPAGQSSCMQSGCAARRACPVGRPYQYEPEHAAFHMQAFLRHDFE